MCVCIRACSCLAQRSLGHSAHLASRLFTFYFSHVLHLDSFSVYSCELRFHPLHHQVVGITFPMVGWIMMGLKRSSRVGERNCVLKINCCTKLQLSFISHQGCVARFQLAFSFRSTYNLPADEHRAAPPVSVRAVDPGTPIHP